MMPASFAQERGLRAILAVLAWLALAGCGSTEHSGGTQAGRRLVVCYTSTDQVFSEPILKAFEEKTGIRVRAKYDTEETKTTGLVNLLQAERARPQADVFWSSETGRAIALRAAGCLAPYKSPSAAGIPDGFKDPEGYWTGFSARARVILYNTRLVQGAPPSSLLDYLRPEWRGKAALANPMFGTTAFHATALFVAWGDERALDFFRRARANGLQVLPSNGAVKNAVADGRAAWGIVDTDDANVAIKDGKPVAMAYPDQDGLGTPVMPNTVSLIAGAPHPEAARALIDYLLSPETEKRLAELDCVQVPLHPGVQTPPNVRPVSAIRPMAVGYAAVAARMQEVTKQLMGVLGL
ncbi:MAG: extracellular solute-binding protein [Planctomycetes bacterium]|nr:extracellular solute-binding protein [Planctomycetota bacterium]